VHTHFPQGAGIVSLVQLPDILHVRMEKCMRKRKWMPLLLVLAFLLAACGRTAEGEPTPSLTGTAETPAQTAAPATQPPQATQPGTTPAAGPAQPAACTVISQPDSSEVEEFFPPVSEDDWIKGNVDARVTIMEYSDFQ
jgi:hypothetical protein